jgi:NDP-sugar pyrophosphorylase family protein
MDNVEKYESSINQNSFRGITSIFKASCASNSKQLESDIKKKTFIPACELEIRIFEETHLKRVASYVKDEEGLCFNYGDGLLYINITAEISFHKSHGKLATVTAVQPSGRYGVPKVSGATFKEFIEKPRGGGGVSTAGFLCCRSAALRVSSGTSRAGIPRRWPALPPMVN